MQLSLRRHKFTTQHTQAYAAAKTGTLTIGRAAVWSQVTLAEIFVFDEICGLTGFLKAVKVSRTVIDDQIHYDFDVALSCFDD